MTKKSKRVKISFDTINKGKYTVIPWKKINETNERIRKHFKQLKFKKMEKKYRVSFYMNDIYEVIDNETNESLFQGSLSDCDAYIRLKENEYI